MTEKHYYFMDNDPRPFPSILTQEQQVQIDSIFREIISQREEVGLLYHMSYDLIKDPRLEGFITHHLVHSIKRISDVED